METKIIEIELNGFTRDGVEGCSQCLDPFAPAHFNCLYIGRSVIGHDCGSRGHCTADACY